MRRVSGQSTQNDQLTKNRKTAFFQGYWYSNCIQITPVLKSMSVDEELELLFYKLIKLKKKMWIYRLRNVTGLAKCVQIVSWLFLKYIFGDSSVFDWDYARNDFVSLEDFYLRSRICKIFMSLHVLIEIWFFHTILTIGSFFGAILGTEGFHRVHCWLIWA